MSRQHIPVIDISDLDAPETRVAIDMACAEWGFFQVTGHGLDEHTVSLLQQQMHAFFAQPLESKCAILRTAENPWGYYDRELTRRTRDWKQTYDYGPPDGDLLKPQWPAHLPDFRSAIEIFYDECNALAMRLLRVIAVNLGVPKHDLDRDFGPAHTSFVRLNYYPKCAQPARPADLTLATEGHLGVNHHTDAGAVTLLLQDDQPGLEVFHDNEWCLVEPRQDALVINIGDIVQVWSNDRYRAALHRALVTAEAERFSVAFFLNPTYSTDFAPLSTTVDARHPPRYRSINWGEFRGRRAAGDYADQGEYTHIGQYGR